MQDVALVFAFIQKNVMWGEENRALITFSSKMAQPNFFFT